MNKITIIILALGLLVGFFGSELFRLSSAEAQTGGIIMVSEDSSRGVVCYAKNYSTDNISCVKVK